MESNEQEIDYVYLPWTKKTQALVPGEVFFTVWESLFSGFTLIILLSALISSPPREFLINNSTCKNEDRVINAHSTR